MNPESTPSSAPQTGGFRFIVPDESTAEALKCAQSRIATITEAVARYQADGLFQKHANAAFVADRRLTAALERQLEILAHIEAGAIAAGVVAAIGVGPSS